MNTESTELSRISKFFVDRDQTTVDDALARRQNYGVTLVCGDDVECSYVLQLAVMTAVSLANRCFPGAVRIALDRRLADSRLLVWPNLVHKSRSHIANLLRLLDLPEGVRQMVLVGDKIGRAHV